MNTTKLDWSGRPVGRPTTDTLTDRYVWAVLKSLPDSKRADIDRELRASIADDVDARVAAGEDPAAAEHAVLLELGEPAKLAASYAGRTLALIGPELYLDYVRLLKLLYAVVLPIAVITHLVIQLLSGASWGGAIGGTVGIAISIIVHIGFWTTFVFVLVERTGTTGLKGSMSPGGPNVAYDPAHLPSVPTGNGAGRSDLIASLVFLVLVPVALVWQQVSSVFENADGSPIPVVNPDLWSFWLPYLLAMVAASLVVAIVLYRTGRWTWPLVAVNAVIAIATTVPVVWLILTGQLLDEAFLDRLGWSIFVGEMSVNAIVVSVVLAGIAVWSIGDTVWKTVRADRLAERA